METEASNVISIQQYSSGEDEDEEEMADPSHSSLGKGFLIDNSPSQDIPTAELIKIGIVCHASPAAITSDSPFLAVPAEKLGSFLNSSLTMSEMKARRTKGGLWRKKDEGPLSATFLFMVLHQRVTLKRALYISCVLNLYFRKTKRADMSQSLGDVLRDMEKEFEFFQCYTTSVAPKSASSPPEFLGRMDGEDDLESLHFKEFSEMEEMAWKIMGTTTDKEESTVSHQAGVPEVLQEENVTLTTSESCSSIRCPDQLGSLPTLRTAESSEFFEELETLGDERQEEELIPGDNDNKTSLTGHWTHPSVATAGQKLDCLYELFYHHADEIVKAGQRCNVAVARCKKVIRENTEVVRNSAQSVRGDLKEQHGKTELKLECVKSAVNKLVSLQQDGEEPKIGTKATKDFVGSFMKEAVQCGKRNMEEKGKGRRTRWLQAMKVTKMFPKPALRFPVREREQLEQICSTPELRGYYVQLVDMTNCKSPISGVRECCRTIMGKYSSLSLNLSFRK